MADGNVVGTVLRFTADGNTFSVAADADLTHGKPKYTKTALPGSGKVMIQMTRQDQNVGGLTVQVDADELGILQELADRREKYSLSYTTAAERVYRGVGHLTFETASTANGTVEITLIVDENGWTLM
jgi:hypothetical protein